VPKLISISDFEFLNTCKYGRSKDNLLDLLQWEVRQKAIIAMTSRDCAPKYFGVLKKNINQISVSDLHKEAKINFEFFVNLQIWPLYSQFTGPFAMGGQSKSHHYHDLEGRCRN
jgi:hypothetical protein